ncbi:MAG: aspartate carbamoyltransferase [bacterium]|nr:aspartate carbamoyltransferase [bacterium]
MKHFLDLSRYDKKGKENLVKTAGEMIELARTGTDLATGKILATLFYEPSTRTRLSFESAMLRLGGRWLGFADTKASSVAKGESLADTVRTVDKYSDVIAIRHPAEGAALAASLYSGVPVINAGDGSHLHPSQTLLDMLTIKTELGRLGDLNLVLAGDLRYGRTASSLALAMAEFGPRIICVTPAGLEFPEHVIRRLRGEFGLKVYQTHSIGDAAVEADVLYVTRIQKERIYGDGEYQPVEGSYVVDDKVVSGMKEKSLVLHPLPRVDEITPSVDARPQARYFDQMFYGVPTRMVLIADLLELINPVAEAAWPEPEELGFKCHNQRCVTNTEEYLPRYFVPTGDIDDTVFADLSDDEPVRCYYCDYRVIGGWETGQEIIDDIR